jgi:hypothetical protein
MSYRSLESIPEESLRTPRTSQLGGEEDPHGDSIIRPEISERQTEFLEVFSACSFMPLDKIRGIVGIRRHTLKKWMTTDEPFKKAMRRHHNQVLRATNMSRKQVMKGILEAIDVAKGQRQATAMISGWKEIGRMCGFYEPERRELVISGENKKLLEDLKTVPRDKLLEMMQEADIAEGELVGAEEESSPEATP